MAVIKMRSPLQVVLNMAHLAVLLQPHMQSCRWHQLAPMLAKQAQSSKSTGGLGVSLSALT